MKRNATNLIYSSLIALKKLEKNAERGKREKVKKEYGRDRDERR